MLVKFIKSKTVIFNLYLFLAEQVINSLFVYGYNYYDSNYYFEKGGEKGNSHFLSLYFESWIETNIYNFFKQFA